MAAKAEAIVIALDGPAAAGKSTVGAAVAAALALTFAESGKLYRALAYQALRRGIALDDEKTLAALARETSLSYEVRAGAPAIIIDGEDVTAALAGPEMAAAASTISAHAEVRAALLALQRRLARPPGVVMEGRDIGTVVFPNAQFKFYLDASLAARAGRRAAELNAAGERITVAEVERQLAARDRRDATRDVAPLRRAPDAVYIDTSDMTFAEVVNYVVGVVRRGGAVGGENVAR